MMLHIGAFFCLLVKSKQEPKAFWFKFNGRSTFLRELRNIASIITGDAPAYASMM